VISHSLRNSCTMNSSFNDHEERTVEWGEEGEAQQPRGRQGDEKDHAKHISEYQLAAPSNRQLALVLQEQGLYDVAVYFAYRAKVMGRKVKWWEWLTPKRAQEFDTWGIEKQLGTNAQKSRGAALRSGLSKKLRELMKQTECNLPDYTFPIFQNYIY
jgi:hypothetical protein